jgi:murein DD-endopeptidase MepM/ murein hydrolase activator NlpD
VVSEIYEDPLMGQTVVLDHGDGTKSYYRNLSPQLPSGIEVGVLVSEGDVIGGVGETVLIECAQTPHLHFEVTVNDEYVDPMEYFK